MSLIIRTLELNRRHPAARRLLFAAAPNGINMVDIVQGQSASRGGGNAGVNSPNLGVAVSKAGAALTWTSRPIATVRQITLAFMGTFASTGVLLTSSNFPPGTILIQNSPNLILKVIATTIDSGIALTAGIPYFLAASYSPDAGVCNFAVRRLDTGALVTAVVASTFFGSGAPSGSIQFSSISMVIKFAIVAANYMPLSALSDWALDPFGLFRSQMLPLSFLAFSPSAPNIYYPPRRKPALILDRPSLIRRG